MRACNVGHGEVPSALLGKTLGISSCCLAHKLGNRRLPSQCLTSPAPITRKGFELTACMRAQLDDPLDAIAVHAWNGTWGVLAVGFFSDNYLIQNSYGLEQDGSTVRPYGCFVGGNGRLLAAQIIYAIWIAGALTLAASCPAQSLTLLVQVLL